MSIWIDPPRWPAHGRLWSHLISDVSADELHAFAQRGGRARAGVRGRPLRRAAGAVRRAGDRGRAPGRGQGAGAHPRASGLRIQKRKGERVVLTRWDAHWIPPPNRFDVIVSTQPHPPPATVVVRLLVLGPRGTVALARRRGGGLDLPAAPVGDKAPSLALAALAGRTVSGASLPTLLGYARNTVWDPEPDGYPWPVPQASFVVFGCSAGAPRTAGRRPHLGRPAGRRAEVPDPALVADLRRPAVMTSAPHAARWRMLCT